jgi:hypothetical protein
MLPHTSKEFSLGIDAQGELFSEKTRGVHIISKDHTVILDILYNNKNVNLYAEQL